MSNYPVNQVFLGSDPFSNQSLDIDSQLQLLKSYENKLNNLKRVPTEVLPSIWAEIDKEIDPLTIDQRKVLFTSKEYIENNSKIENLVQLELLNLVRGKIETSESGKELLTTQLNIVKKLKSTIVEESNREIELFKQFREYSKNNPGTTYDDFIKLR